MCDSAAAGTDGGADDSALRKRIGWQLVFGTGMHFIGMMIGMQAEQEIWIQHFAGDFAANASMTGRLQSISGIISFAINPIIAAASDAFGRRPCMLVAQATALWRCAAMSANPSITNLIIGDLSRSLTMSTWFIAAQASLGDLFKTEPKVYGRFQSFFQMMPPAMSIICPMLGQTLAARSLRLPYVVGTLMYLINMVNVWLAIPETCDQVARVPFSIRGFNPLSFSKLFVNGSRLRLLALAEALSALADGRSTFQVGMLDRRSRLGWDMKQAAQFQSFASGLYVPGFLLVAPMVSALGTGQSYFIGCFSQVVQNILYGLSSRTWHYYATVCFTSPTRALPQVALKTVTMQCAVDVGMAQGELQGALSNLQTVCRIAAPMIWPNIFAWGTSRGMPQVLYFSAAVANLVQLQLSTVILRADKLRLKPCDAEAPPREKPRKPTQQDS